MSIIELITIPFFNVFVWFFSILPTVTLPTDFFETFDTFVGLLTSLGYFLPLPTVSAIFVLYFSYYFLRFTFSAIRFLLSYTPFLKPNK
ncbi:MAG: hypothetical protein KAI16_02565 [Candidatus Pacebacteria bacterium]|nr:hypothetical protein [Candidatus Paceibacterota bacterium]